MYPSGTSANSVSPSVSALVGCTQSTFLPSMLIEKLHRAKRESIQVNTITSMISVPIPDLLNHRVRALFLVPYASSSRSPSLQYMPFFYYYVHWLRPTWTRVIDGCRHFSLRCKQSDEEASGPPRGNPSAILPHFCSKALCIWNGSEHRLSKGDASTRRHNASCILVYLSITPLHGSIPHVTGNIFTISEGHRISWYKYKSSRNEAFRDSFHEKNRNIMYS